jgi:hypothetical protein
MAHVQLTESEQKSDGSDGKKVYAIYDTCCDMDRLITMDEKKAFRFAVEHALGLHGGVVESTLVTIHTLDQLQTTASPELDFSDYHLVYEMAVKYHFDDLLPEIQEYMKMMKDSSKMRSGSSL